MDKVCGNCRFFTKMGDGNCDKGCYGFCSFKGLYTICKHNNEEPCFPFSETLTKPCPSLKIDYYNGRSCLNHIENFFAFHEFLSPYENFYIGNIIKYLWRYKKKNGVKDLEKAKEYLEFLINEQERNNYNE